MHWRLQVDVEWEIQKLLNDPESYRQVNMVSRPIYAVSRDDGTEYYGTIEVEFRAANAFGGMVPGHAKVEIVEDEEGVCNVTNAYLLE